MAVIEVVPGVSWYDTFYDAMLGATVPTGWTKYGSGALSVIADGAAYGGRLISVATSAEVALGLDVAGTPANFEVVMRMRASGESSSFNPVAVFGGPGGRIILDDYLGGVAANVGCTSYYKTCEFFCSLGYVTVEYPDWASLAHSGGDPNQVYLVGGNGTDTSVGSVPSAISPYSVGNNGEYWASGGPNILVPQPNGSLCSTTNSRGGIAHFFIVVRLRVIGTKVSLRAWWSDFQVEPTYWHVKDVELINLYWPQAVGPVGFISPLVTRNTWYDVCYPGQTGNSVLTYIDYIGVSLDPENTDAPIPGDPVSITSTCPLPSAKRGELYEYQILSTVPAP